MSFEFLVDIVLFFEVVILFGTTDSTVAFQLSNSLNLKEVSSYFNIQGKWVYFLVTAYYRTSVLTLNL